MGAASRYKRRLMPALLHFSENPHISVFHPHIPARSSGAFSGPMVWAVDEEHAPGFWVPRDCPRACCWSGGRPLSETGRALLGLGAGERMHAVEGAWLERVRACTLYVYRFDPEPFEFYNRNAGYHAARQTLIPLSVEPVGDVLDLHARAGIELRIVPNLWPLIDAIIGSDLEFSIIHKEDALPRASS